MRLTWLLLLQLQLAFRSCWAQSIAGGLLNSVFSNDVNNVLRTLHDTRHHDFHRSHQAHHGHRHVRHTHRGPKIKMPSGNVYAIKSAKESEKVCKMRSNLLTLKSNDRKWKKEYYIVKKEIENTNKNSQLKFKIVKIQKVFNPCLWKKYKYRNWQIHSEAKSTNEQILFYGTNIAHDLAVRGFDERYRGNKGKFGAGFSFTAQSSRSHVISGKKAGREGTYQMLLCRVTLGKMHKETSPQTYAHAPVGYQSVVGEIGGNTDYVVYRGEQVYPEYLVTYKT